MLTSFSKTSLLSTFPPVAVCSVLAGARFAAVWAHGGGVSVHVSRRGCDHSPVPGQERYKGESLCFQQKHLYKNMLCHSGVFHKRWLEPH